MLNGVTGFLLFLGKVLVTAGIGEFELSFCLGCKEIHGRWYPFIKFWNKVILCYFLMWYLVANWETHTSLAALIVYLRKSTLQFASLLQFINLSDIFLFPAVGSFYWFVQYNAFERNKLDYSAVPVIVSSF